MRFLLVGLVTLSLSAAGRTLSVAEGADSCTSATGSSCESVDDQPAAVVPDAATRVQILAEAERIRAQHGGAPVRAGGAIDPVARRRADDAFRWLASVGPRYRADALVIDTLMRTYALLGDYYVGSYPTAAWLGYAGANHWARRNWLLYPGSAQIQANLARYALGWASVAYANGSWFWRPPELTQSNPVPSEAPGLRETTLERVPVPEVDESGMTNEQRAAWAEVRNQFVLVSSRVHEARVLLERMSQRLSQRGMSLNGKDGGTALSMQGFLIDAADLINERDFERAVQALTRAEYERNKLRGTTGQ
jgi:hypothetical protein